MKMPQNRKGSGRTPKGKFAKGHSGNPGGRPKNGESITAWMRDLLNKTPAAAADEFEAYAQQLRAGGDKVPFAGLIAVRQLMALANEPDARLLREVLDRTEGKVPTVLKTWRDEWIDGLKRGEITPEWVRKTLGEDSLAQELFMAAGVTLADD